LKLQRQTAIPTPVTSASCCSFCNAPVSPRIEGVRPVQYEAMPVAHRCRSLGRVEEDERPAAPAADCVTRPQSPALPAPAESARPTHSEPGPCALGWRRGGTDWGILALLGTGAAVPGMGLGGWPLLLQMVHVSPLPVGQHCVQRAALPCTALPSLLPSLTRAACRLPFFLPSLLWCALVLSFLSAALLARCILCLTLRVGPDRRYIQPERDAGIDVYSFIISQRWLRCLLDRRNLHGWPYLLGAVHPVSCVRRRPP
jgi:hypothetical protein